MPLFDRLVARQPTGRVWLITAVIHVVALTLFFTVQWAPPWRSGVSVPPAEREMGDTLMFILGTGEVRAKGPTVRTTRREPAPPVTEPPPVVAALRPDTAPTMPAYDPNASKVAPAPQVGDGLLWVSPRPGLPAAVAAAIYGDTAAEHAAAVNRLRAMVDSLSQMIDEEQREHRRPSWTVGGTAEKPNWGLDSQYIHIAGIKIPSAVLAALGAIKGFPQGNYDEELHARQLNYMREDIMQSAARAQSLAQFKRYVHELRERKQAERDAEQRRRAQDTVKAVP